VLFAAPGALIWFAYRPDQIRFLSPIWPPLVLLAAAALASATVSAAALSRPAAFVPVAAATLLVVANVVSIDGLGSRQWRDLWHMGSSGWGSRAAMENFAYGPFSYPLTASRANLGPDDELISSDGRLAYFFPGRTDIRYPRSCADLRGRRVFVLLTSGESAQILTRLYKTSSDPLSWLQCASPRVFAVDERPGVNATFVIGRPPSVRPSADACSIRAYPGQLSDAVFGDDLTYTRAKRLREAAASVGFGAKIERTACSTFHVVVTGVPVEARKSFVKEAAGAGFRVAIVPAVRYPEVRPDVAPVR
jgi:hypothetical protein